MTQQINADPQYIRELVKQNKELKLLVISLIILLALESIAIYTATNLIVK